LSVLFLGTGLVLCLTSGLGFFCNCAKKDIKLMDGINPNRQQNVNIKI
jgi:hypothetical protein